MDVNQKLQRTFVRQEAYVLLRDWIIEGKLAPNQKLRDKELAEQLGVSRTPIREALLRLEDEGLVQSKPNSATFVCPLDLQESSHFYSIVWTLEKLALTQAFPLITSEHVEAMTEANQRLLQALKDNDRLLAIRADDEFHAVYIQLSQNKELQKIISNLKFKLNRLELYYFEHIKDAYLSVEEHQKIIEALQKGDLQLALKAVETNWSASFARIQR